MHYASPYLLVKLCKIWHKSLKFSYNLYNFIYIIADLR